MSAGTIDRLRAALGRSYRLERELGAGGMATVYLAHDLKHERDVAIKVLHPDLGAALGGERFLSEIRTTARLQHPHILPLLDSGEADGLLYYVMPLVTGETLRARLDRERQLPIADAVRIAREVASALDYAHRQQVIHRDIKPENILLHDGQAIVADFGIALAVQTAGGQRMTQTGLSLGTPQYMSPEQAMGERTVDARSDIYALGVVTYEMLTGDPPFTGSSVQAVVAKVVSAEPERPSLTRKAVTPAIEAAVLRALEKLPADRFGTAAEFATALAKEPAGTATPARPALVSRPSNARVLSVGALALIAGAVGGWLAHSTSTTSLPTAPPRALRLTHSGQVGCAAIAPGGRRFALVVGGYADEAGGTRSRAALCGGTLVVRPMPTGPDQVIARVELVETLRWSPAGDALILVGRPENKARGVWLFPTNGGAARQLAPGRSLSVGFVDAGHIYVVPNNLMMGAPDRPVLRVLDAQSGAVTDSTRLPGRTGGDVVVSPSGRWISYKSGESANHLVVSRTGEVVDSMPGGGYIFAWVGDSAMAYLQNEGWRLGDLMFRRVDPATGRFDGEPLVIQGGVTQGGSLTADVVTNQLMWVPRIVTDELHLMLLPSPTTTRVVARSLNAYLGLPVFSPDGQRVAYTRQDVLGANAYVLDLASGQETAASSDTIAATTLYWPTAQHLLRATSDGALMSYDLATGRTRTYAPPANEHMDGAAGNSWTFFRQGAAFLIRRDSTLQSPRDIANPPDLRGPTSSALSRDGVMIARVGRAADGRGAFALYNTTTSIWSPTTPLDTVPRRLTDVSSDGTLYFTRFNGRTEVWRARVGSDPSLHATLPVRCYEFSVTVSDDGSRAMCNVSSSLPDAWVLDLPRERR